MTSLLRIFTLQLHHLLTSHPHQHHIQCRCLFGVGEIVVWQQEGIISLTPTMVPLKDFVVFTTALPAPPFSAVLSLAVARRPVPRKSAVMRGSMFLTFKIWRLIVRSVVCPSKCSMIFISHTYMEI